MKRVLDVVSICAIFLLSASLGFAQGGRGTINGTVQDASGATIANAQVTIKDVLTGTVTNLTTTSDGHYSAPFLQPGKYEVSTAKHGFVSKTQRPAGPTLFPLACLQ